MEARILEDRDSRRYIALRAQAANEHTKHTSRDLERELFLLADHATTAMSQHARQGTLIWGVYDGHPLVGTLAVSRHFNAQMLNYLWLWGLYVRPRYRGTPASRLLMDAMLKWSDAQPAEQRLLASYPVTCKQVERFLYRWGFHPATDNFVREICNEAGDSCVIFERERESPRVS